MSFSATQVNHLAQVNRMLQRVVERQKEVITQGIMIKTVWE
jgi:hypothetical protein